jgi:tetratricopeptide (TPR) repeat protein
MLSFVVAFRGNLQLAATLSTELVRAGQDAADPQVASWGFQNLGYPGLARGPLDEVAANLRKGQALAAKIPAWQNLVYEIALLSKCLVLQGKLDDALAAVGKALEIIKVEELRSEFDRVEALTALAQVNLALADRLEGSPRRAVMRDARRACRNALRSARQMPGWLPEALRLQGTSDWLFGNQAAAHKRWRESLTVAEKFAFPVERARTLLEIGYRTGDIDLIQQAAEVFRQSGAKVLLAFALHYVAQLRSRSSNDTAAAIHDYAKAIVALEEVRAEYELASACTECARLHEQLGQNDEARAHLEKAKKSFIARAVLGHPILAGPRST